MAEGVITASALAEITGVSIQRLWQLANSGTIPKTTRRGYPHPAAIRAYCAHLREEAAGRGGGEAQAGLAQEKALLARQQREGHEIKNAQLRGELISASEAERRWAGEMVRLRARLLAVPAEINQALPHLTKHDVSECDRVLRDAMTEASFAARDAAGPYDLAGNGAAEAAIAPAAVGLDRTEPAPAGRPRRKVGAGPALAVSEGNR